jgi:lycopene cyclase domain-containing protein
MNLLYLAGLLVALTGMVVLDVRFRLFFAVAPLRAAVVLATGIAFFLLWDLAGIGLGVFFRGNPAVLTGLQLAPELPVEELFFLALLCYSTMNLYAVATRAVQYRFARRVPR